MLCVHGRWMLLVELFYHKRVRLPGSLKRTLGAAEIDKS